MHFVRVPEDSNFIYGVDGQRYCTIPAVSTVQILPFASLMSLYPRPSSGFAEEVEEADAFCTFPVVPTR